MSMHASLWRLWRGSFLLKSLLVAMFFLSMAACADDPPSPPKAQSTPPAMAQTTVAVEGVATPPVPAFGMQVPQPYYRPPVGFGVGAPGMH
jgi:hypothetical protein